MPIYEYTCGECGAEYEMLVRMNASDADIECPRCGQHKSRKRVSACGQSGRAGNAAADTSSCSPAGRFR